MQKYLYLTNCLFNLTQGATPTKDYCSLEDYPEGPIGKLQVLKSGRCRLILGDISFDMRMGTPSSFYEVRLKK